MKLNEILQEAVEKLSLSDFPIISNNISNRHKEYLNRSIATINEALAKKYIANPVFKDTKDSLNRVVEDASQKFIGDKYTNAGKWEDLPELIQHDLPSWVSGLSNVNAALKKIEKFQKTITHKALDDSKAMLLEAMKLVNVVAVLKEYNVKIKRRTPEEREEDSKRDFAARVSHIDVKKIYDLLTEITKEVRAKVLEAKLDMVTRLFENWKAQYDPKNSKTDPYNFFGAFNYFGYLIVSKCVTIQNGRTYVVLPDYREILKKEAISLTDEMLQMFIVKNTKKLSAIATAKNNLKDVNIVKSETARGVVEGTLHLSFNDGSHFTVDNKVVQTFSKYGKPFYRFPTTFHNVVMPDGSKMKGVSEESMNEVFTKA